MSLATAIREDITRPLYLVDMGFDTPIRLSSRSTEIWDGSTWLAASITVTITEKPTIKIFNESTLIGQTVLTQGTSGRTVKIYQAYMEGSSFTTPVLMFTGEMGQSSIGREVIIQCKRSAPNRTPRQFAVPPTFKHLPKAGTVIETAKQTIILE